MQLLAEHSFHDFDTFQRKEKNYVNDVIKIILKKITDFGSHKQPTFNDGETDVENTVKRIGWSNLCRMDEYELRTRVKSLND